MICFSAIPQNPTTSPQGLIIRRLTSGHPTLIYFQSLLQTLPVCCLTTVCIFCLEAPGSLLGFVCPQSVSLHHPPSALSAD
ncbi:hypothetical protein BD310DRAFT_708852 [Dichomitus squalens]|uniref:Uncharacterized protein n=1 Tax=Dichomitus squalens TaxID=114155 RepID=A0A4Q9PLS2_9APHY|nr:hypothetical protein BD310DRAFT_708852 [Dichomitus squalens]